MAILDYRTAGESHGRALLVIVEGMPSGLAVDTDYINAELRRRQGGFGRSGRQHIEHDEIEILSGLRRGRTLGSPIAMRISNRDHRIDEAPSIHRPRPGHADFPGAMKFLTTDCRDILERASARETAARVAAGALAAGLLSEFGVQTVGFVCRIGSAACTPGPDWLPEQLRAARDKNEAYCPDAQAAARMIEVITQTRRDRDTIGGVVEVRVFGLPPGIGSCMRWQDKLDGRLMGALGSIQAFKGVEIGLGFGCASRPGSQVHDELDFIAAERDTPNLGFRRRTNNAGGLEGGMTNGMTVVVRGVMKPISTLLRGLDSVNLETLKPERSDYERSDICAVPAASVVAENVVAFEIARGFVSKFGGDTMTEVRAAYEAYLNAARALPPPSGGRNAKPGRKRKHKKKEPPQ
jgi:chorismate synthase